MIALNDVTKRYPDGTVAVGGLTMEMAGGEITVLLGSSGCGKTTTLRMINRLIEPTSGTIELDGKDLGSVPVHELRRGIGYVIQQAGLFPHRTVADNIATVPRLLGWEKERGRKRALELLELVGLGTALADRYPRQLSGGQQQRVGVARALAADPPVLLMDEPFGAVDPVRRGQLQQEFRRLQRDLGKTVVFVTHDVDEAVLLGDRIAIMRQGGIVAQYGPPEELLARPSDDFVSSFIGGTRGLKLLSLRSADEVPVSDVARVGPDGAASSRDGIDGWGVRVDDAGRPLAWVALEGDAPETRVAPVGPGKSLRDLIDSAVSSPARAGVRVDADGVLLGAVPFSALEEHLPAPEVVKESQGAV
jgi:osmoprotectant transport system ATP-binding protein